MAKKILLGVVGIVVLAIVGVLGMASTQPDTIHVERSVTMNASAADVFPYANDFEMFMAWIPWTELDPDQKVEFSDPASGVGAWYTWQGNDQVGKGRMEILSAEPGKVVDKLEFIEPFPSVAEATLLMKDTGTDQVQVTWSFEQQADFPTKVMCVFMDMDAMMGPDFEKGLNKLQALVESDVAARKVAEAEAKAAQEAAAEAAAEEDVDELVPVKR
ncbi:MAG: SRPBCC family protein [Alphaproteobacteria bacterium]|nr:SRPBCC family protein [Alphaproteobacteria bacterium]